MVSEQVIDGHPIFGAVTLHAESAADFADLRKVLGIEVWNVYATSYGSYVAQTLMRDHPEGIGHKVRCGSILADATVRFAPIVDMA